MSKVAIIGIVGESVFLGVNTLPKGGETVHANRMFTELGGKGFNQAVAVARFGGEVSFLAAVGQDGYKQKVQDFCEKEGITLFLVEKEDRTAYAVIETEQSGENCVTVFQGARLDECDLDAFEKEIKTADYLLITNEIPLEVLQKSIKVAYRYATKVIFNPAPYRELDKESKDKVYLFTPNEHETKGLENYQNIVVTLGAKGSYIKALDRIVPSEKVEAIDTTGAGDTFNGVLTVMLSQGNRIEQAVEIANKVAGISTMKRGAVGAIPYKKEIEGL